MVLICLLDVQNNFDGFALSKHLHDHDGTNCNLINRAYARLFKMLSSHEAVFCLFLFWH